MAHASCIGLYVIPAARTIDPGPARHVPACLGPVCLAPVCLGPVSLGHDAEEASGSSIVRAVGITRRAATAAAVLTLALPRPARAAPALRIGGTGSALGGMQLLGDTLAALGLCPGVKTVRDLGTVGGIRAVAAGAIDLSVSARPLTAEERATGLRDRLYATTPLVFATHLMTPVEALTHDQAVAIIGGTMGEWLDGTPVRLSRRPGRDADTLILAGLSPDMAAAVAVLQQREGLSTAASDHDQAAVLEASRGSFGVITLALVRTERRPLRVPWLDGYAPDGANWPMQKTLYAVTRVTSAPAVQAFLESLFSPDTAALLTALGHVMPVRE